LQLTGKFRLSLFGLASLIRSKYKLQIISVGHEILQLKPTIPGEYPAFDGLQLEPEIPDA
jgi:hypothetical protein